VGVSFSRADSKIDTYQQSYIAPVDLTGVRIAYLNAISNQGNGAPGENPSFGSPINIQCSLIVNSAATQVKFGGARSATLPYQRACTTDLVPTSIARGTKYYVRTRVTTLGNTGWPLTLQPSFDLSSGDYGTTADVLLDASKQPAMHPPVLFGPAAILGRAAPQASSELLLDHSVIMVGDSILSGVTSYLHLAALAAQVPILNFGRGGEALKDFVDPLGGLGRRFFLKSAPILVVEYGVNDLLLRDEAAEKVKGEFLDLVRRFKASGGKRVIAVSITPIASSTIGRFDYPESQYPRAYVAARNAYQRFLSTLKSWDLGLDYRFVDVASAVEYLFPGSDRWVGTGGALTNDGVHPNALGVQKILAAKQQELVQAMRAAF
jgi:lysophospholipase L1-like esterase